MKMIVAAISALAGVVVVAADQAAPRMDRSKLLIGAYSFNKPVHDEPHVRDLKDGMLQDYNVFVLARDGDFLCLTAYTGKSAGSSAATCGMSLC